MNTVKEKIVAIEFSIEAALDISKADEMELFEASIVQQEKTSQIWRTLYNFGFLENKDYVISFKKQSNVIHVIFDISKMKAEYPIVESILRKKFPCYEKEIAKLFGEN